MVLGLILETKEGTVPAWKAVIANGGVALVRVVVDVPAMLLKSAVMGLEPTNKLEPGIPVVGVSVPGAPKVAFQTPGTAAAAILKLLPTVAS